MKNLVGYGTAWLISVEIQCWSRSGQIICRREGHRGEQSAKRCASLFTSLPQSIQQYPGPVIGSSLVGVARLT